MMRSESEDHDLDNKAYECDANGSTNHEVKPKQEKDGFQNVGFSRSADDVFVSIPASKEVTTTPAKPYGGDEEKMYRYGWRGFKPGFIQKFNRIGIFVFWAIVLCVTEGFTVNGIANAALPHLEKQFGLQSSKSALITSSQDIGALAVVLFVSFIGGRYNKASWVAGGSLISAVGSFLFMVPHLATNAPLIASSGSSSVSTICDLQNSTSGSGPTSGDGSGLSHYLGVFMIAQMVHGVGFTPMLSLGTAYIDENAEPASAAIYVGLTYAAAAVGVAIGFFAGGQLTEKFYVDYDRVDQASLDFGPRDPRWIGGWWIGFTVSVLLFALASIPLFGFPRAIPGSEKHSNELAQDANDREEKPVLTVIKDTVVDFFKAVLKFLGNLELMFLSLGGAAETLIILGVGAFAFKYLAEQYDMPFDQAGYLLGGLILFSAFGMVLGGILIRVFHLEGVGMARLNVGLCVLSSILGFALLAKCPNVQLAGMEIPYPGESSVDANTATCRESCDCSKQMYNPVCGADDIVYYSPCHAGCINQNTLGPLATYGNCSCVAHSTMNRTTNDVISTAVKGRCDIDCNNLYILAPLLFVMLLSVLTTTTPVSMATLRCVDPQLKPFALGFQWMLMRLLGSIPGPVLIGFVLDSSCEIWSPPSPDGTRFCMLYNKHRMSIGVFTWWIVVNIIAALCFLIASIASARKRKSMDL
ncbi:solute carrier organic anion transporter family member 4A1-like [Haliotis cracherodii]|uniref:solute carrier organic anion transporter family member 4A1-like n=1 Tax=Haliotis cracherodii TaxID=6455 RepID=UPI0039ECE07B